MPGAEPRPLSHYLRQLAAPGPALAQLISILPLWFAGAMALLPLGHGSLAVFLVLHSLWVASSWTISPMVQGYLT